MLPYDPAHGQAILIDWHRWSIDVPLCDLAFLIALHWSAERRAAFEHPQPGPREACTCLMAPSTRLISVNELGLDSQLAEVSVLMCQDCGQHWLRYFYNVEAFTASGRWYLGAITTEQLATLTVEKAKATLEGLNWYYYGGSYYRGRAGGTSGTITLSP